MTPDPTGEPPSTGRRTLTPRAAFWCALTIWALALGVLAISRIYNFLHPLPPALAVQQGDAAAGGIGTAFIVAFTSVGALLGWKRPANPIGWLLSATGLSYAAGSFGELLLLHFPGPGTWANWTGLAFLRHRVRGVRPAVFPYR